MDTEAERAKLTDESDRGCVLVGAAILEKRLEELFRGLFRSQGIESKIQEPLFDANGPLATYSSKARLAYALGLIPADTYHDLDAIRKLRNEVAHTTATFDFLDESVGRRVDSLNCVRREKEQHGLQRYSITEQVPAPVEARIRVAGFVKARKADFAFGVGRLEIELLQASIRSLARSRERAATDGKSTS